MRSRYITASALLACCASAPLFAQAAPSTANPVATALRGELARESRNLIGAAEGMPADKYSFKPTEAQLTFGAVMAHVAETNDFMCSRITGAKPPEHAKVTATDSKETLVAAVKASFDYCTTTLAPLDDSKLGEMLTYFGTRQVTRANMMLDLTGDWYDHYGSVSVYMRLAGTLPPTARRTAPAAAATPAKP